MLLLPFQKELAADKTRFRIALWGRQSGKGYTSAFISTSDAVSSPRNNWIIAAPTERQAIETLEKCKDWAAEFSATFAEGEVEAGDADVFGVKPKAKIIVFGNGSKIYALPGRPASLRGFSGNLILDEFAFFENGAAVWKAIYPVITNPASGVKRILITSTPAGKGNQFHKLVDENYLNPIEGRKLHWSVHKVTIHQVAKDWEAAGMLAGMTAGEYVEEIRAGFDTPEAWPQEFECEFADSDNFLLPYDILALAESNQAGKFAAPAIYGGTTAPSLFLGIDFGRQNDPTVCWTLQREGDVLWTREVLVLKGMSTPDQQAALETRLRGCARACFDYTGPGIGLGDYLVRDPAIGIYAPDRHRFGRLELCVFTPAFKREIFPRLRRAFEAPTRLRIPVDAEIREDLHAMRQIVNAGQYTYFAAHTKEGHSDRCTALALALRAAGHKGPAPQITLFRRADRWREGGIRREEGVLL
ncbi:MAG: terminase family protein [Puniceicoccales bacterium]|jgi:phage FluMu gp28-like protein|nr:terminase family protein [Puniceicoccales bacterium]